MLGTIDWGAIWNVAWASLALGIGVSAVFSLALYGATRFEELRAQGRTAAATLYGFLGLAAIAVFLGAVTLGLVVMTQK